jgi:hypothetical protein
VILKTRIRVGNGLINSPMTCLAVQALRSVPASTPDRYLTKIAIIRRPRSGSETKTGKNIGLNGPD